MTITVNSKWTTQLTVKGPEDVLVTSTGEFDCRGTCLGIEHTSATVNGYLHSTGSGTIYMVGATLTIGSNPEARVVGYEDAINAVNGGTITNGGTVLAHHSTISGAYHPLIVVNTGTIEAQLQNAIAYSGGRISDFHLSLTNSGTIKASFLAVTAAGTDDTVVNSGHIETGVGTRAIWLGYGNDLYDGRGGTVTGSVDLDAGNDTAYGGWGDELFDGGDGNDTFIYTGMADLTVDLHLTTAQNTGDGNDTFHGFENLTGAQGRDLLTGGDDANDIRGGGNDDTLLGGKGDDRLFGGSGNNLVEGGEGGDVLDGGGGSSVASYQHAANAVIVDLADIGRNTGDAAGDSYVGIDALWGSSHDDALFGNAASNWIVADQGADRIEGRAGGDLLYGADGNDTLVGGADADALDGGDGVDTAIFSGTFSDYEITTSDGKIVVADKRPGQDGRDVLTSVEVLKFADRVVTGSDPATPADPGAPTGAQPLDLWGTARADVLAGGMMNDRLHGLAGRDLLVGLGGSDTLVGGAGSDTLTGGTGQDVFVFDAKRAATTARNKSYNLDKISDFWAPDDTIWLAKKVFGHLGRKGELSNSAFHTGAAAHDASDRIVYNKKTGALLYDDDGSGSHAAVQFATLKTGLKLSYHDFHVI